MANKTYFKGNNKKRKNTKKYQFAGFDEATQIDNTGYLNALYNPKYFDTTAVSNETIQKNIDQTINTSKQSSADYAADKEANKQSLLNLTARRKQAQEEEKASMRNMAEQTAQQYTAKNVGAITGLTTQATKFGVDLVAKKAAEKTAATAANLITPTVATNVGANAAKTGVQAGISGTNLLYSGLGAAGVVGGEAWKYFSDDKNPYTYKPSEAAGTIGGNTLSWAGTGAGIGTAIMPGLGTLIGAGVGALGGLTVGLVQNRKKKKMAASLESERAEQEADWNAQKAEYDKYLGQRQRVYDYNQRVARTGMTTLAEQSRQNRLMGLTEGQLAGNTNINMTGGGRKYFGKGGVNVPGGQVVPIGQGAVEFVGRSHAQGGIRLDAKTEVEGGETMDKVRMKNGKMNDYFFSKFLKYKGKSFAQHHKELIKRGASQEEIQALAKKQEAIANRKGEKDRSPNQVAEYGGLRKYQTAGPDETVGPAGLTLKEAKKLASQVHMPIKMTADAAEKWEKVREIGNHPGKKTLVNGVWVVDSSPLIHEFDLKSEELLKTFVNPEDAKIAKYPVFRYGSRYLDAVSYSQIGLRDQDRKLPYFTSVPPAQIPSDFRPFNNIVGNTAAYYEYPHMMTGKETDEEKLIRAINKLKYNTGYTKNTDYSDKDRINDMARDKNWSPEFTKKVLDYKGKPIIQNPVMYVGIPQDDRNFDQKYGPHTWIKTTDNLDKNQTGGVRKYQTGKFKLGKVIGTTENNSGAPQSFNDINKIIPMPKNPTPEEGEAYWDAVQAYCAKFPGANGCYNGSYHDKVENPKPGEAVRVFSEKKFKSFPYHIQAMLAAADPGGVGKLEVAGFPASYERPRGLGPGKTTTFLVDTPEEIEDYMKKSKELDLKMKNFDKNYGPNNWVNYKKLGGIKKYQTGNFLGEEIEDSNSTNSVYWNNQNINTEEETPSKSQTLDTLVTKKEGNKWVVRDEQGNILGKSMDRSAAEAKAQNAVIIANQKKNESTTQKGNTAAPSNSKFGPYKNVNILNDFGALGRSVTNLNQVPYKKGMNAAAYRGLNSKAKTGKLTFTPAGNLTFTSESTKQNQNTSFQSPQMAMLQKYMPQPTGNPQDYLNFSVDNLNNYTSTTAAQTANTTKNPPANSKFGPYKNLPAYKIPNNFGALGFKSTNNNSKDAPKDNKEDAYSKMYSPEQIKTAKILAGIGFGSQMIAPISSIFMKPNLVSAPTPIVPGMIDTAAAKSVAPMISAGKVEAPRLGRVTPETEDIMNRDVANRQFFSNIGDPSSMIAMIASTGKTNEAERKAIADAQRTNVELAGKEGMLKFEASKANVASSLEAQRANQAAINEAQGRYLNVLSKNQEMKNQAYLANLDARTKTRLANAQLLADKQNRDIAAMTTFGTNAAGGVGDFLSYGIEGEKSRMASGDTGVYERNFIPIFGTKDKDKDKDGTSKTGGVRKKMYGGTNSYTSRLGDLKFKRALKVK